MVSDITTTCQTQVAQGRASHIEFTSLTKSLFLGASLKITLYLWILRLQIAKQKNTFQEKRDPWYKAEQQEFLQINYKDHSQKN